MIARVSRSGLSVEAKILNAFSMKAGGLSVLDARMERWQPRVRLRHGFSVQPRQACSGTRRHPCRPIGPWYHAPPTVRRRVRHTLAVSLQLLCRRPQLSDHLGSDLHGPQGHEAPNDLAHGRQRLDVDGDRLGGSLEGQRQDQVDTVRSRPDEVEVGESEADLSHGAGAPDGLELTQTECRIDSRRRWKAWGGNWSRRNALPEAACRPRRHR